LTRTSSFLLSAVLLSSGLSFPCAVSAQDPAHPRGPTAWVPPSRVEDFPHGLPGERPGTEIWVVLFKKRSFGLSEIRKAIREGKPASVRTQIIAKYPTLAAADQAPFVRKTEKLGGRLVCQWWLVNGCAIEIPRSALPRVAAMENVGYMHPDRYVGPLVRPSLQGDTDIYNHMADRAHARGWTGIGDPVATHPAHQPVIAILDGGIDFMHQGTQPLRPHKAFYIDGDPTKTVSGGIQGSRIISNPGDPNGVYTIPPHFPDPGADPQLDDDLEKVPPKAEPNHGTAVTAIAAGAKWNNSEYAHDGQAPRCLILSYNMRHTDGTTSKVTQTDAWQQVGTDRGSYNIVAANMSFGGSSDPMDSTQRALDSLAYNFDVLVTVGSGNTGPALNDSQYCANGLTVGAVRPTHKELPPPDDKSRLPNDGNPGVPSPLTWSGYGPMNLTSTGGGTSNPWGLSANPWGVCTAGYERNYPDVVASGFVLTAMMDREDGFIYLTGTSMAAPAVCGAGALFRAGPDKNNGYYKSALETKAAILATAESITAQNAGSEVALGEGFLRTDRLAYVDNNGVPSEPDLELTTTEFTINGGVGNETTHTLAVTQGLTYSVVVCWFRPVIANVLANDWPHLDLTIDGPGGLNESAAYFTKDTHEKIRFTAPTTGTATITVHVSYMPTGQNQVKYALATCVLKDVRKRSGAAIMETTASYDTYGQSSISACTVTHGASKGLGAVQFKLPGPIDPAGNADYLPGSAKLASLSFSDNSAGGVFYPQQLTANLVRSSYNRIALPVDLWDTRPNCGNLPSLKWNSISFKCRAGHRRTIKLEIYEDVGRYDICYALNGSQPTRSRFPFPDLTKTKLKATAEMQVGTVEAYYEAYFDPIIVPSCSTPFYFVVFDAPPDFEWCYVPRLHPRNRPTDPQLLLPDWVTVSNTGQSVSWTNYTLPQCKLPRTVWWHWALDVSRPAPKWGEEYGVRPHPSEDRVWEMRGHVEGSVDHYAVLDFDGLPKVGGSMKLKLFYGSPGKPYVLYQGLQKAVIPVNQGGTCNVLTTSDYLLHAGLVNATNKVLQLGGATEELALPLDTALLGVQMYHQFLVLDSSATEPIVTTNGGEGRIGW